MDAEGEANFWAALRADPADAADGGELRRRIEPWPTEEKFWSALRADPADAADGGEPRRRIEPWPTEDTSLWGIPADAASSSREPWRRLEKGSSEGTSLWDLMPDVFRLWLPMMGAYVFMYATELINTIVVGSLEDPFALAGVGLANMMQNCFAMSLCLGLACGMDTFVSQAHGAGDVVLTGHYLQRCRAIATLNIVWMYPLLYYSESVLSLLREDPMVSQCAGAYNRASLWGLVAFIQFSVTKQYLQNRQDVKAVLGITFLTTSLHPFWSIHFVHTCRYGNAGAGYANSVTWWLQYLLLMFYVSCSSRKLGLRAWTLLGIEGPGFEDWWSYIEVAVPSILQTASEIWFWEIFSVIVGYLSTDALAAQVAIVNFLPVFLMPCYNLSFAGATLTGIAIGEGSAIKAQRTVCAVLTLNLCICVVFGVALLLGKAWIAGIYTTDPEVRHLIEGVIAYYALANFWDSSQFVMGGVLRGLGHMKVAGVTSVTMYYAIDLPLLIALGLVLHQSLLTIWVGVSVGALVATCVYSFVLCCRTDFQALVDGASYPPD